MIKNNKNKIIITNYLLLINIIVIPIFIIRNGISLQKYYYISFIMSTLREIVYMVLDELKGFSDDFNYTEEHIAYLANKYRCLVLLKQYSTIKKQIPDNNYQTIVLELEKVFNNALNECDNNKYLRSTDTIPALLPIGLVRISAVDDCSNELVYVSKDRIKFVGNNKFLKNFIYCTIDDDNRLYLKSCNPQYLYLERVKMTAIFQELYFTQDEDDCEDILDEVFPLENGLIPLVIEAVVKELSRVLYNMPKDVRNNANDDISELKQRQQQPEQEQ